MAIDIGINKADIKDIKDSMNKQLDKAKAEAEIKAIEEKKMSIEEVNELFKQKLGERKGYTINKTNKKILMQQMAKLATEGFGKSQPVKLQSTEEAAAKIAAAELKREKKLARREEQIRKTKEGQIKARERLLK